MTWRGTNPKRHPWFAQAEPQPTGRTFPPPEPGEDLDPHRVATSLENGVPHCYLGHPDCYDMHTAERLADEADWRDEW